MISRHFHWEFTAYDGEPVEDKIHWGVTVEVIGFLCEADALIAARDIVARDNFKLRRLWECASCGYQQEAVDAVRDLVKAQS